MKYNQTLKNMWHGASKEESRHARRAIYADVEHHAAVVTDGHLLAIVDISDLLEDGENSFLIPVEALRAADALFVKFKSRIKQAKAPEVFIRASEDSIIVSVAGSRRSQSFDKMCGQFPKWAEVYPKNIEKYTTSICLSQDLLVSLARCLSTKSNMIGGVLLSFSDAGSVILVTSQNTGDTRKSCGLLMPMRATSDTKATPFWNQEVQA